MTSIDIPALTDTVAKRIASGQSALHNRRDMAIVRRAAMRAGYSNERAARVIEDTCSLAALYRTATRD